MFTGGVLALVFIIIFYIMFYPSFYSLKGRVLLEFSWIMFPSFITFLLLFPSLNLWYLKDIFPSLLNVKRVGHQWYWSYSYSPFEKEFDSFLDRGSIRLLRRDNKVVLPFNKRVEISTSREDVIHSWALPSLNIKIDSNPGRVNSINLLRSFPGVIYGQCREICGANHSFIPIEVEFTSLSLFLNWLKR